MARKLWIDTNAVIRIVTDYPKALAEEVRNASKSRVWRADFAPNSLASALAPISWLAWV